MSKVRIDQLLVNQGYFPSREQAQRSIMAGLVYVDEQRVDKPGTKVEANAVVRLEGQLHPYVSRGGLKLEKALKSFAVDVADKIAIDVGASTGGFTDCLLQNGTKLVYAVDVVYGQLDWKLRNDPRVVVMERTNIRYLSLAELGQPAEIATIDVAFISLTKFFQNLLDLLTEEGEIIALIKPQFEAGRDLVGKHGVVRDPNVHKQVIINLVNKLQENGVGLLGLDHSPIRGPKGNIEFLAYFRKAAPIYDCTELANLVVERAWSELEL